ncbi:alpha-1 2-mannosidase (plasmid) [Fulvitalea axinellae]|uniref:Alpha-1 2-mannosidase n=1 Tax=Fulvitalea axinellae TaxID=1182444 RepID=A0AAU9CUD5_9BACT|nr:alpha-1 2-mannosidase [Fulvitalea axinellae]
MKTNRIANGLTALVLGALSIACGPDKTKTGMATAAADEDPTVFVDPFVGTGSYGHTYPGASVAHGMVQLSPDNGYSGWDRISGYHYSDTLIGSFSHTHFTGTGVGDLYDVAFMPAVAPFKVAAKINPKKYGEMTGFYSAFSHDDESATPGYYKVLLRDYGITVELTATQRAGLQKYTFPESKDARVSLDVNRAMNWDGTTDAEIRVVNDRRVEGYRKSSGWASDQRIYFVSEFSKPFKKHEAKQFAYGKEKTKRNARAEFFFETEKGETILVRTGISSVSVENARLNLESEMPDFDFDKYRTAAHDDWKEKLSKVTVSGGKKEDKTSFYTAIYQSMLAPTLFSDVNGQYKGVDGETKTTKSKRYDTFSLWDTFRAAHPLYTITEPENVTDMVNSMLDHFDEAGRLPVWSFAGNETDCMIGYHSVPVIVDAYLKGIKGIDGERAFKAMKTTAMMDRKGLETLKSLGYVAQDDEKESVSLTLEYAFDDWCIAQMAKVLGHEKDYAYFTKRANAYRNLYDKETGFMRGRNKDGKWAKGWSPLDYHTGQYIEGNAWQYSWFVPHDPKGHADLMGGYDNYVKKLDAFFHTEHPEPEGGWPVWISGLKGIYVHGNEPGHHAAYLYAYAKAPWKGQKILREIMTELHTAKPDGICGNEDCGQMSAWYAFSAMGFYPANPTGGIYAIGTPIFEKSEIKVAGDKTFTVKAENLSDKNYYIQSATLNGKSYDKAYITHSDITAGGELVFVMGDKPNKNWASSDASLPPSMSGKKLLMAGK